MVMIIEYAIIIAHGNWGATNTHTRTRARVKDDKLKANIVSVLKNLKPV